MTKVTAMKELNKCSKGRTRIGKYISQSALKVMTFLSLVVSYAST